MAEKGDRFLKISARVFTVLAWLSPVVGLVVGAPLLAGSGLPETPRAAGVAFLILGGIYFFVFGAFSAVIRLLLEIARRG